MRKARSRFPSAAGRGVDTPTLAATRARSRAVATLWVALVATSTLPSLAIPVAFVRTDGDDTLCNGTVDADASNAPNCAFATLEKAVLEVDPGGTIQVGPGTFVNPAQVVLSKDMTIDGAGAGSTLFRPGFDTGSSGDSRGWWLVDPGVSLALADFTMNGTGHEVFQGIRHRGSGTIDRVGFTEIQFEPNGPAFQGVAVAAFGDGAVDVSSCTFTGIGAVGVLYFGAGVSGSVFRDNTFTGKGVGDHRDRAVELGAGAVAEIRDNTVSRIRGFAAVGSAAIFITTFFGPGTSGTITGNGITDSVIGISIGPDDPTDTSAATVMGNTFHGNDTSIRVFASSSVTITDNCIANSLIGITFRPDAVGSAHMNNIVGNDLGAFYDGAASVDFEDNWWGAPDGPSAPDGAGSGDGVDGTSGGGTIDFVPFSAISLIAPPCPASDLELIRFTISD